MVELRHGLRTTLGLFLIAASIAASGLTRAGTEEQVFFQLNTSLQNAADAARKTQQLTDAEIDTLQIKVAVLQQRLQELKGGTPQPYLQSFVVYSKSLERALAKPEGKSVAITWRAIAADVSLKLDFVRSSAGISASVSPFVTVSIEVYKGVREIPGIYLIQCNQQLVADQEPAFYSSPQPAPVGKLQFLPGQYVCFAVSEHVRVVRQPVSIGQNAAREEQIRLLVP